MGIRPERLSGRLAIGNRKSTIEQSVHNTNIPQTPAMVQLRNDACQPCQDGQVFCLAILAMLMAKTPRNHYGPTLSGFKRPQIAGN
jgi:hypothetical protein